MFFPKDIIKAGESPAAHEKIGLSRFIEILAADSVNLFKLNLLFLVSCIPILTIPPAIFAMNCVVRRMILDEPVQCVSNYRIAFQTYWKRSYGAFFLTVFPLVCSSYGAWFYLSRALDQPLFYLPFAFCSTVFLAVLLSSTYFYALLAGGQSVRESLRPAVFLGLGKPLRAVLAALAVYGSLVACVLAFPLSGAYLLMIGFSVPCLVGSFFVRVPLKRFYG